MAATDGRFLQAGWSNPEVSYSQFNQEDIAALEKLLALMPYGYWAGVPYMIEDILADIKGQPRPKRQFFVEG